GSKRGASSHNGGGTPLYRSVTAADNALQATRSGAGSVSPAAGGVSLGKWLPDRRRRCPVPGRFSRRSAGCFTMWTAGRPMRSARTITLTLLLAGGALLASVPAHALRCDGKVVREGMLEVEVLA